MNSSMGMKMMMSDYIFFTNGTHIVLDKVVALVQRVDTYPGRLDEFNWYVECEGANTYRLENETEYQKIVQALTKFWELKYANK